MGNLLAYSGTATKIRGMRRKLLTAKDFQHLASLTSVSEAIGFLKTKSAYSKIFKDSDETSLHRGEIEKMLTNAIYMDFQKIYRFATVHQRKILDLYFRRYEIGLLKTCMRMVFDHRDVKLDLSIFKDFFEKHSDLDVAALSNCKTLEEFVNILKGSIYYKPLILLSDLSDPTLWDYEMALDLCYFKWFWEGRKKVLTRSEEKIFMEDYGVKMDLLNIRWIYRSKHFYNMSNADVYAHLIDVQYHLQPCEIRNMVEAPTMDDLNAAIKHTYYGRHYPEESKLSLDEAYYQIRYQIQRKNAREDPLSIAVIISYLYEKEHEVDDLTTTLECIRYGLPSSETQNYISNLKRGCNR